MEIDKKDFEEMLELVNKINTETENNAITIVVIRRIKEILLKTLIPHIN
jgi:hypothetical protein